jgi:hypothetical protein
VHLDELVPHADSIVTPGNTLPAKKAKNHDLLASQLRSSVEAASDDDGWAKLSDVGQLLTKRYPDFDSRSYGYHKLSDLITASSLFEISRRCLPKNSSTEIYIRDGRRKFK